MGLKIRAHAEQVTHTGIAAVAARLGATTVDHLERCTEKDIDTLAEFGTVATLLPGAQLYLKDSSPPVAALRAAGVPMAVATDLNPGSSPIHDLWTCATLACLLQGLTFLKPYWGSLEMQVERLVLITWDGLERVHQAIVFCWYAPPGEPPF